MLRRARTVAWLTLATLEAFTLVAGVTVARMLPPRLAAVQPARVRTVPVTRAGRVLAAASPSGPRPTSAGIAAAVAGPLSSGALGSPVAAMVADAGSGRVFYAENGATPVAPASTAKLATAVAALHVLGPWHRFVTRVVAGPAPDGVVLVGGGDPTLAAGAPPASQYPQPATLRRLAAETAQALVARHRTRVTVGYDTSLYTGPSMAPGWPTSYVTTGDVTPITSLEVDQGRLTANGTPQDAYDSTNYRPRSTDPARVAADAFAAFLARDGVHVIDEPINQPAPARAVTLAAVSSPPLAAIVQLMLLNSDNVIAENLARQVALATGEPASFAGAATAVRTTLARLGVHGGISMVDGSGLSPLDRVTVGTLVRLLTLAASPHHPALRAVVAGLPVAGFAGTLAPGESVFGGIAGTALGVVRAKTGNLATVAALAGFVDDANGRLLAFAFDAPDIPKPADLDAAAAALDDAAGALAACGCRSP